MLYTIVTVFGLIVCSISLYVIVRDYEFIFKLIKSKRTIIKDPWFFRKRIAMDLLFTIANIVGMFVSVRTCPIFQMSASVHLAIILTSPNMYMPDRIRFRSMTARYKYGIFLLVGLLITLADKLIIIGGIQ